MSRKGPTRAIGAKQLVRAREAWKLYIRDGLSSEEIGHALGVSAATIEKDIGFLRQKAADRLYQQVADYTEREVIQLTELYDSLEHKRSRGDVYAITESRKILESRRKLLGLDRDKQRVELTGTGGGAIQLQSVASEVIKIFQGRQTKTLEVPARETPDAASEL